MFYLYYIDICSKFQVNRTIFKVRIKIKKYYTPVVRFVSRVCGIFEKSNWELFCLDKKTRVPFYYTTVIIISKFYQENSTWYILYYLAIVRFAFYSEDCTEICLYTAICPIISYHAYSLQRASEERSVHLIAC